MNNRPAKLTKEELQKQVGFPTVYKEAIEHAICDVSSPNDTEDVLWSDYFRAEVVVVESYNELRNDDKLKDAEYCIEATWFLSGWEARQKLDCCEKRTEVSSENIVKTISSATRR